MRFRAFHDLLSDPARDKLLAYASKLKPRGSILLPDGTWTPPGSDQGAWDHWLEIQVKDHRLRKIYLAIRDHVDFSTFTEEGEAWAWAVNWCEHCQQTFLQYSDAHVHPWSDHFDDEEDEEDD